MSRKLDAILKVLSESLDTDLYIDEHGACKITLNDKIAIQLELDSSEHYLIMGSMLYEIPPGKFRENVLKEALKANNGSHKGIGTLAFVPKSATLALFEFFPLPQIRDEKIFEYFVAFATKGSYWKETLSNGQIPQSSHVQTYSTLNPFGIR